MPRGIYQGNKGRKAWNKGIKVPYKPRKPVSEETKEKIRKALLGRVTKPDRYCLICGKNGVRKGRKFCSIKCTGVSFKGKSGGFVGKKHSDETKKKMSNAKKGKKFRLEVRIKMRGRGGEKSHFWRGGITDVNALIRGSFEYREWRTSVFKRDNYTCVWCGARNGNGKRITLNADHIKKFSDHPELRFEITNGRTLCRECHMKTDTYGGGKKRI